MTKKLFFGSVLCLFLSAPAYAGETKESFDAAYQAAEAARKQAGEVDFEWRDTKKMLEQAQEMAAAGDYDGAVKLANEAKQQGELGVEQARIEAQTWQNRVIK